MIRKTFATQLVQEALLRASSESPAWGYQIQAATGLTSGTVYPILERLAKAGMVRTWSETGPVPGKPPRRFYELTAACREQAEIARKSLRKQLRDQGET